MNNSPWIAQLPHRDDYIFVDHDNNSDVCIIGGGIAGIMSAYYILLYSDKTVTICDAHKIAHGATGHNAGQIAPYFEKSFDKLVQKYGY
jgi:glycine/D-amino acid oxidase-like deaminating enzyme